MSTPVQVQRGISASHDGAIASCQQQPEPRSRDLATLMHRVPSTPCAHGPCVVTALHWGPMMDA